MPELSRYQITKFRKTIYSYYHKCGRHDLPWRNTNNPYHILVSEFMLQQTQVARIIDKYNSFIKRFPGIEHLGKSSLKSVLRMWSGLGYNRRAVYLHNTAKIICKEYNGKIPEIYAELIHLPGISHATAGEILAFAFNIPTVFIETNIRSVYIYSFFNTVNNVNDKTIIPLIEQTLDKSNPRLWYYALMDYGVMIKKENKGVSHRSRQYKKQSRFEGSNRQIRGIIIKALLKNPLTEKELVQTTGITGSKIKQTLTGLCKEGFIKIKRNKYTII